MLKLTLRSLGAAFASALLAGSANAAESSKLPTTMTELFGDSVLARGKGVEVKRSRLDEELVSIKATAAARGQTIPAEQMTALESRILERLIHIQLLLARANEEDKAKGKSNALQRIDEIKTRAGSEETLARQLKAVGTTLPELTTKLTDELVAESVLERELGVNIGDADVKKFYDENPAKFEQPEMVRASHILLGTRDSATGAELAADKKAEKKKQIEDLLKRARAGEDFAKLAREFSEDPGSKDKGGEYTFPRGQMVPEFEAAAFKLNTNEVSDVVTTQFGYHIIKLHEKLPAQTVPLEKVKTNIINHLKAEAVQPKLPPYMEKLSKEAGVEILDEKLKTKAGAQPADTAPAGKN